MGFPPNCMASRFAEAAPTPIRTSLVGVDWKNGFHGPPSRARTRRNGAHSIAFGGQSVGDEGRDGCGQGRVAAFLGFLWPPLWDSCRQVVTQSKRVQAQVVRAIETGAAAQTEGTFEVLLEINDSLIKNITQYDQLTAEIQQVLQAAAEPPPSSGAGAFAPAGAAAFAPAGAAQPLATLAAPPAQPQRAADPLDELLGLDDLQLEGLGSAPKPAAPAAAPATQGNLVVEEDDFFSSRAAAAAQPLPSMPATASPPVAAVAPVPAPAVAPAPAPQPPVPATAPAPAAPVDDFDAFVGSRSTPAPEVPPPAPAAAAATTAPAAAPAPAPAAPSAAVDDDDDFDTFLDTRLKGTQ